MVLAQYLHFFYYMLLGTNIKRKLRGPTLMHVLYTRRLEDKKIIKLYREFQAIVEDDKVLSEFKFFLGYWVDRLFLLIALVGINYMYNKRRSYEFC